MSDTKYTAAVEAIEDLKAKNAMIRINPDGKGDVYLYALLAAYGTPWDGERWQPFAGNPMVVHA